MFDKTAVAGPAVLGFPWRSMPELPDGVSSVDAGIATVDGLVNSIDTIVSRSATGLRTCKEALAFVRERAAIEEAYGNGLIRQSSSLAGAAERGTCRMGWYAFKSKTEQLGRKHLQLASHCGTWP